MKTKRSPRKPRTLTKEQLREHIETHDRTNSWYMNDAMGIPLCKVCDVCKETRKLDYDPEVLGERGRYTDKVEDRIEDDY